MISTVCRLFILVLVGISILWIPVIQQMAGGQLYIYIQAVASYLSPPIAMVYCLAIAWPRMNEMGAFWSLMYGLTVGLVRMVLDFTFPEPLCLELDDRPALVKSVSCLSVRQGQLSINSRHSLAGSLHVLRCRALPHHGTGGGGNQSAHTAAQGLHGEL